jgi:uncharacterized protein
MLSIDWIEQRINALPWNRQTRQFKEQVRSTIYNEYSKEILNHPKIAIIGKAGVGKTSTINSLFNTKLRVGRTQTGTYKPKSVRIKTEGDQITGEQGEIIIYDLPGLADDIDRDKRNIQFYHDVLSQCDVAVWVIAAEDRSLSSDQHLLKEVVRNSNPELISRLVIGINKIDLVSPNNWNYKINLPSKAQERNFERVINRVRKSIWKVCPEVNNDHFVAYSAMQFYNLLPLFRIMLQSCPNERAWLLNERASIANSFSLLPDSLKINLLGFQGERIHGNS